MIRPFTATISIAFAALMVCSLFNSGCSPSGQVETSPEQKAPETARASGNLDPVPESTYKAWQDHRSYYALLEIVDAHIDPCGGYESPCGEPRSYRATKAEVRRLLGDSIDKDYPHAGPDTWVYSSDRHVPLGSYLVIEFDKQGLVKEIGWVSE